MVNGGQKFKIIYHGKVEVYQVRTVSYVRVFPELPSDRKKHNFVSSRDE